jgi:hypothetical protein
MGEFWQILRSVHLSPPFGTICVRESINGIRDEPDFVWKNCAVCDLDYFARPLLLVSMRPKSRVRLPLEGKTFD